MTTIIYSVILFDVDTDGTVGLSEYGVWIEIPALILTLVYLLDLVANVIVLGPKRLWESRRILLLETVLQLVYWTSYIIDFTLESSVSIYGRFARINALF